MEMEFSNQAATPDEKQQTGWYDLPFEMRMMIIEMMDTDTRVNLLSCSKLCCQEVRRSKNFATAIHLSHMWGGEIKIRVVYQDPNLCCMLFENYSIYNRNENVYDSDSESDGENERCLISYENWNEERVIKCRTKVDGTMEVAALDHFNRYVNQFIRVEEIFIRSSWFPFDKTSIAHLKNLETIEIEQNGPIDLLECGFLTMNQLVSATKTVHIEGTNIEIEQLINFKASKITLRNVTYSTAQLNQYIGAWSDNQTSENTKLIEFGDAEDSYRVVDDPDNGLDVVLNDDDSDVKMFIVESSTGKLAKVVYSTGFLTLCFIGHCDEFDCSDEENDGEYDDSGEEYNEADN